MSHSARPFLVCYDLKDPRRLARVHRLLRAEGVPIQYSVFLVRKTARQLERLVAALSAEIDPRKDDVRIYPLPGRGEIVSIGRQLLPEGVMLFGKSLQALAEGPFQCQLFDEPDFSPTPFASA